MKQYRFLVIGAHPDDCDLMAGGLAMKMKAKGHEVFFLSATDGSAGHQTQSRDEIRARRADELRKAGEVLNVTYECLPVWDGELTADLTNRHLLMRRIRELAPDVIITHRTCDYHPDHRACGQLVMDCCYMLGVPLVCPETPALHKAPVVLSMWDSFTHPEPFHADLAVSVDEVIDQKIEANLCHISQFYEWLPYMGGRFAPVEEAKTFDEKTAVLRQVFKERFAVSAKLYPHLLPEGTQYAESFEWNEYGAALTDDLVQVMTK